MDQSEVILRERARHNLDALSDCIAVVTRQTRLIVATAERLRGSRLPGFAQIDYLITHLKKAISEMELSGYWSQEKLKQLTPDDPPPEGN